MVTSECLKYARENGCDWDWRTCSFAAENGHLECLTYARKRVSFGRRASRPGLLLRLRLRLRREFQFCEFVLGRSRLLRYALVKVNKDAIKYYTLVIQTPTKNTPQSLFLLLLFLVKKVSDNVVCFLEAIRLSPFCKTSKDSPFSSSSHSSHSFGRGSFGCLLSKWSRICFAFFICAMHRTLHL